MSTDVQKLVELSGPDSTVQARVSDTMVGLYKAYFGRGPTKARTDWAGNDTLVVVLEHTLTHAESNLVRMGEHGRLRDTRTVFQYAHVREFCDPIEDITGRKVRAFVSGIDTEVDGLSTEMFVLHPEGYDGPSRSYDVRSRSSVSVEQDRTTQPGIRTGRKRSARPAVIAIERRRPGTR
jgi:uncharacterized protein YbcI